MQGGLSIKKHFRVYFRCCIDTTFKTNTWLSQILTPHLFQSLKFNQWIFQGFLYGSSYYLWLSFPVCWIFSYTLSCGCRLTLFQTTKDSFWILSPISFLQSNLRVRYLLLQSGGYTAVPHAAAAKSLQSCPTLCDPIDGSPPGSPIPGILQARTLEWVAISLNISMDVRLLGSLKVLHLFLQNMIAAVLLCLLSLLFFSPSLLFLPFSKFCSFWMKNNLTLSLLFLPPPTNFCDIKIFSPQSSLEETWFHLENRAFFFFFLLLFCY